MGAMKRLASGRFSGRMQNERNRINQSIDGKNQPNH